jgi:hypothetical protein
MRIKKLFKTESEYLDYAWSFINFDEKKIWREEDLPKLQPYFDMYKNRPDKSKLSENEWAALKESMNHYDRCKEEYADELFEIRDSISQFDIRELSEFFFLEPIETDCWDYDEDGNEIDEDGNIIPPTTRESIKISEEWKDEMIFPLYFVGHINCDSDRLGKFRIGYSEFVTLKDFEK